MASESPIRWESWGSSEPVSVSSATIGAARSRSTSPGSWAGSSSTVTVTAGSGSAVRMTDTAIAPGTSVAAL